MENAGGKRGKFDDMEDDIPWTEEHGNNQFYDPLRDDLSDLPPDVAAKIKENSRKNSNRKYKAQRNRHTLVFCTHCEFKFRTSAKNIKLIRAWNCIACEHGTLEQEQ